MLIIDKVLLKNDKVSTTLATRLLKNDNIRARLENREIKYLILERVKLVITALKMPAKQVIMGTARNQFKYVQNSLADGFCGVYGK